MTITLHWYYLLAIPPIMILYVLAAISGKIGPRL